MAEVKVFLKNSIPSLSRLIVNYRREGINKLLEFTTAKSKEYGIIPKSSTVVADLRVTSSTSRKFFKKIYTSLYNQVAKKVPYMDFMEKDEVEMANSGLSLTVPLITTRILVNMEGLVDVDDVGLKPNGKSSLHVSDPIIYSHLESSGADFDSKTIRRYLEYLNYKAARNGCPIKLFLRVRAEAIEGLPRGGSLLMPVLFFMNIKVELGSWYVGDMADGDIPVSYGFGSFDISPDTYSRYPECSSFNLFTFLDDISKVIRTLSRKGNYNASAYII